MKCLPAEWAPQSAVLLTWPHAHGDWANNLTQTEHVFLQLVSTISQYESVIISCYDEAHRKQIQQQLQAQGIDKERFQLYIQTSDDSWARDHGPITIIDSNINDQQNPKQVCLLDFQFNGWGNKYPATQDNRISQGLYQQRAFVDIKMKSIPMVLEGGSIESDGKGTLLTTEACLLNPTRNPDLNKKQIEQQLIHYFGINRILWLKHGYLEGDDTDSHIDMLARFCSPDTIAFTSCEDPTDTHYKPLQEMEKELRTFKTASGVPYRLIPLPLPTAIYNNQDKRLPASYANFLIINKAVLLPVYNDPMDQVAIKNLQQAFPGRTVIAINCLPIIQQYGSLHCLTMQLPEGVLGPIQADLI